MGDCCIIKSTKRAYRIVDHVQVACLLITEPPLNMHKHILRQSLSSHLHIKPRSSRRARILDFQPHPMRGSGLFIPIYSIAYGLDSYIAATRRYICKDAYTMKRKNRSLENPSAPKRARPELPEYHATPPVRDENGVVVWPAPDSQIEQARAMILDW